MSDAEIESETTDDAEAARRFARRVQGEVAAAADRRRREDPGLAREEREIERVWADIAPIGAAGRRDELLLDRVERLSLIDVDAPIGERPGARQLKSVIRKGTYWYLRYMSDQLNALHGVQARLLRRMEERVVRLEAAAGLGSFVDDVLGPPPPPSAAVGAAAADEFRAAVGPVMVASCGAGEALSPLAEAGIAVHGVDADPALVVAGVERGLDVRVADPREELRSSEPASLGGVLLGGFASRATLTEIGDLIDEVVRVLRPGGVLVVAGDDPQSRPEPERELTAGRGLSPAAWALVLDPVGVDVRVVETGDDRVSTLVVARMP